MSKSIVALILVTYSLGQLVTISADPLVADNNDFDNQYGSAILDKILRGKKVKVSLENARKLTFEQDNNGCSLCENGNTVTNGTSTTTFAPNIITVDIVNGGHGPYGFATCNIVQPQQDMPLLFITGTRPNACNYQLVGAHSPPVDVPSYLTYDPVDNVYIGVDPNTGQVYYKALAGNYPCGPGGGAAGGASTLVEPLLYTYEVQCIDTRGIVSNTVQFSVKFPPCNVPSDPGYTCTSTST